jgi:hypothetical protein
MLFKHLLLLPLLLLPFARSLAQTLINNPNLSAFTRAATYSYTVDPTNGWVYVSGFGTRAMGLPRTGMGELRRMEQWMPTGSLLRCTVCFDTLPPPTVICTYMGGRLLPGPGLSRASRRPAAAVRCNLQAGGER